MEDQINFGKLVGRINFLWKRFAEIEDVLFLQRSDSPEEAADNIIREISRLQEYAKSLNKK